MKCEKCGIEHDGSFGSGRFCSKACANTRVISEEMKRNLSCRMREIPDRYCSQCGKQLSRQGRNALKAGLCKDCTAKNKTGKGKYGADSAHWGSYIAAKRAIIKDEAIDLLGGKCQKCGYNKKIGLDFHHIDPSQKEFSLSTNGWTRSRERVLLEVKKCMLLCSNCHRELHEELRQGNTLEQFMAP